MHWSPLLLVSAASRRAAWQLNSPAWRVWLSRQHQLRQIQIQIANELERDLVLLALEYKRFVADLEAALDTDPDSLIGELAAVQLAHAREAASQLWHAPAKEHAGIKRRLRTSSYAPDRLAVALYDAWRHPHSTRRKRPRHE